MWYIVLSLIIIVLLVIILVQTSETQVNKPTVKEQLPHKSSKTFIEEITKEKLNLINDIHYDIVKNIVDLNHIKLIKSLLNIWIEPYNYYSETKLTYFSYEKQNVDSHFLEYYNQSCILLAKYFNATYKTTGLRNVTRYTEEIEGEGGNPYDSEEILISFYEMDISEWKHRLYEINTKILLNK